VIDLPIPVLLNLINGRDGLQWSNENAAAILYIAENGGWNADQIGNAFPGKDRPAPGPIEQAQPRARVRLRAPEGTSSFSHGGVNHAIPEDRHITVDADVADALRAHGFVEAA